MTPKEFFTPLAATWRKRCEARQIKIGTITEQKLQLEFMLGAVEALKLTNHADFQNLNSYLWFIIPVGRNILTEMESIDSYTEN